MTVNGKRDGTCRWCGKEMAPTGLCPKCLKVHDRIVKVVMGVIFVLSVICFGLYYFEFVA